MLFFSLNFLHTPIYLAAVGVTDGMGVDISLPLNLFLSFDFTGETDLDFLSCSPRLIDFCFTGLRPRLAGKKIDTGCPISLGPLCFCYFLGF